MPIIFGFLAGDMLGRAVFSRIAMTFAMWFAIAYVGFRIGAANVSPIAGTVLAVLLPGALLVWSLVRPATSRAKIWLIEGMLVMIFACQLWYGAKAALLILVAGFRIANMAAALLSALYVLALWGLRTALLAWVRRSDRVSGPRSLLRVA